MTTDTRAPAEQALQASRFRLFTLWLGPLCGLFTVLYLVAALALGAPRFLAASLLALLLGLSCAVGHVCARQGRLEAAAWAVGGTLLAVAFLFSLVLPYAYPTLVVMPVAAMALVLPYLQGLSLRRFAACAAAASLGSAAAGLGLRTASGIPAELERLFVLATLAIAVSLTLLALWQFSSRLRELLERVREADTRKSDFVAVLSHELRNPLASIRTAAALLSRPLPNGLTAPLATAQAELVEREAAHMARLLEDLLDTARLGRGELVLRPEPVAVAELLARAAELVRPALAARGGTLQVDAGPPGLGVHGDPVRLVQVLSNLLHNAVKYSPDGARIGLTARQVGGDVELEVRDAGQGVEAQDQARIFEPFAQGGDPLTRSGGGLGLGLALVRQLVALHHGSVRVHSAGRGQGSTFTVRLPALAEAVMHAPEAAAPAPSPQEQGARVLVVDDNVNAARSLSLLLKLSGYQVEVAHDGPSALVRAREWQPTHVVMDIGMPQMDGYAVAQQLRAQPALAGVRLFALTGYGQEEHRERARSVGFEEHFTKPVSPELLLRALASNA
ncbi:hybrid sensor histidine kinase/response regulator [Aggregicoccus sp. 17bor-14]|uniref:hybrid sensor histidine kinase/response regulator n=1 Tax=Myxococcaceae TaxID=31 RepID=UPI00129C58D8|nr:MULTISPECIES: ATP-binding protein [Myxococcaceae]MBF5044953.1 response regulator [Simulacricoccus sp. 17bor-14]MRI90696.1 hybrid sensor histidine kinase/response regulator [Aggregicoccus sp. 17bor-14]